MNIFILKKSEIQGEGIFASRDYKKSDFVVRLQGKKIKWKLGLNSPKSAKERKPMLRGSLNWEACKE